MLREGVTRGRRNPLHFTLPAARALSLKAGRAGASLAWTWPAYGAGLWPRCLQKTPCALPVAGERLRQLREARGLAIEAGIAGPTVSAIESGVNLPSVATAEALAADMGC